MKKHFKLAILLFSIAFLFFGPKDIKASEYEYDMYYPEDGITDYYPSQSYIIEGTQILQETFGALTLTANAADKNTDGYLQESEAEEIEGIMIIDPVSDLSALSYFPNAEALFITDFVGKELTIPTVNAKIDYLYVEPTVASVKINAPKVKSIVVSVVDLTKAENGNYVVNSMDVGDHIGTCDSVDLSNCKSAEYIAVCLEGINQVKLPKKGNKLSFLELENLDIKSVDFSNCKKLETLYSNGCEYWSSFDVSKCSNLQYVGVNFVPKLTTFDFSKNTKMKTFGSEQGKRVTFSKGSKAKYYGGTTAVELNAHLRELRDIEKDNWNYRINSYSGAYSYFVFKDITNHNWLSDDPYIEITKKRFPHTYSMLKEEIDYNKDGWLSEVELNNVIRVVIEKPTKDISEIDEFPNLQQLTIAFYNNKKLVIKNKTITKIRVDTENESLIIDAPYVKDIFAGYMTVDGHSWMNSRWDKNPKRMKSLDLSKCTSANKIDIGFDDITSIKMPAKNKNLAILGISRANVKSIDYSKYQNLGHLCLYYNKNMDKPDLSKNKKLQALWYITTKTETLDLSNNKMLEQVLFTKQTTPKLAKGLSLYTRHVTNHGVYKVEYRLERKYGL